MTTAKELRRRFPPTVKCIEYPHRRSRRFFSARSVGKIICHALKNHRPPKPDEEPFRVQLRTAIDECFPCGAEEDADTQEQEIQQAVKSSLLLTLADNRSLLLTGAAILAAILALPRIITFLPAFLLPIGATGLRFAVTQVPGIVGRMRASAAANDAAIRLVSALR